jgi:hypothetical protein
LRAELSKMEQFLKEGIKSLTSPLAKVQETHLTLLNSETQLKGSIIHALKEKS